MFREYDRGVSLTDSDAVKPNARMQLSDNGEFLVVHPSLLCNVRCSFCFQTRFDHQIHLSDAVLYETLMPVYARVKHMVLLGGEPTVIPGLDRYVEFLTTNYPHINLEIVTNGIRLSERWLNLLSTRRIKVTLSLNASRGDVYARIQNLRDGQALWQKCLDNVLEILRRRRIGGANDPRPTLSMVVTQETANDVTDFVGLSAALETDCKVLLDCRGFRFQATDAVLAAYPFLRTVAGMRIGATLVHLVNALDDERIPAARLDDQDTREAHAQILAARDRFAVTYPLPESPGAGIIPSFVRRDEDRPFGAENGTIDDKPVCLAPWRGLVVTPNGDAYVCSRMNEYPIGNVNEVTLDEILDGSGVAHVRAEMLSGRYPYCATWCPANLATHPGSSPRHDSTEAAPFARRDSINVLRDARGERP